MGEDLLQILFSEENGENLQLPDPSLLQYYKDLKERIYWIEGEISNSFLDLISKIIDWNREDQNIPFSQRKPIKIYINSPGGSLDVAKTLIEMFGISKTPIHTYALGSCSSAASLLFLAGHKRYALPSVTFVIHKGSCSGIEGDFQQVQSFMKDYEQQIAEMVEFYKQHTSYSPDIIEDKMNRGDWYVKIDEALENKIVDEIITDISILY